MSTGTPTAHARPYKVTKITHNRRINSDGTRTAEYQVDVEHEGGVTGQVTVPAGPGAAQAAHTAIMQQNAEINAIQALPPTMGT